MKKLIVIFCLLLLNEEGSIIVTDIGNNSIDIKNIEKPFWMVFYHGWNCKDCFSKLDAAIRKSDSNPRIFALIRCKRSIILRKEQLQIVKLLMEFDDYYFDEFQTNDSWPPKNPEGGLFGKYKVEITPSLLYVDENRKIYLDYKYLFGKKNSDKDICERIKEKTAKR